MNKFEVGRTYVSASTLRNNNYPRSCDCRNVSATFKVVARVGDTLTIQDRRGVKRLARAVRDPSLNCEIIRPIDTALRATRFTKFSLVKNLYEEG